MKNLLQRILGGGGCGSGCKKILAILVSCAMLMSVVPVAYASYVQFTQGGEIHCTLAADHEDLLTLIASGRPFFFRTNPSLSGSTSSFLYGYGYGYFAGGTYGYGYGFGYGYDYFSDYAYDWYDDEDYGKLGLGTGSSYGEFAIPVQTSGSYKQATLQAPLSMDGQAGGLTGVRVILPSGLTLKGPAGWDGTIDVTSGTTVPSVINDDFDSANVVTISTGGYPIGLSGAAVVRVPYADFDNATSALVKLVDGSGDEFSSADSNFNDCGSTYTGDDEDADELADGANYGLSSNVALDDPEQCYLYYNDYVYMATNHFTVFAAGEATVSGGNSGIVGGGSGGSTKKKVVKETAETTEGAEEALPESVSDFTDLVGLAVTSWQYPVIQQMLDLGLFKGMMVNGKLVFNMTGNMTRGMAATTVCRYMGCDENAAVTTISFNDVAKSAWYAAPVAYLKANGVVNGKTPTTFDPNGTVTRAEFFKMTVEAYMKQHPSVATEWEGLMTGTTTYFADVKATNWYAGYMKLAAEKSLMKGYVEGGVRYARGGKNVTRVEAAAMLSYMLNL